MSDPKQKVRDLMTADLVTLNRNDKLSVADDVMRLGRIRHIPVVDDDGALVGIVSQRDLFFNALMRALGYGSVSAAKALDAFYVKDAMHEGLVTISPEASLEEAALLMVQRKIGCLLVTEQGRLIGILTESDFVALAAGQK